MLFLFLNVDMIPKNLTKEVGRKKDWKSANSQQACDKAAVICVSKCERALTCFNHLFKVKLFVHGAGWGLDQRSRRLFAVGSLPL